MSKKKYNKRTGPGALVSAAYANQEVTISQLIDAVRHLFIERDAAIAERDAALRLVRQMALEK